MKNLSIKVGETYKKSRKLFVVVASSNDLITLKKVENPIELYYYLTTDFVKKFHKVKTSL